MSYIMLPAMAHMWLMFYLFFNIFILTFQHCLRKHAVSYVREPNYLKD